MSAPLILEARSPAITSLDLFRLLRWIDGTPLIGHIEDYRQRIFTAVLDEKDAAGRPRFNLALLGRAKKNWKSADLILASLFALLSGAPGGAQVYLVANDLDQADDNLELAKKIVAANPPVAERLAVKVKTIERVDGRGFLEILPARDVAGSHGKTYRLLALDEIHAYRDWDLLEALQLDPTRAEAQMLITSYASLFHRPGAPLHDLMQRARSGQDPRMFFSWYGADFTTDPDFATLTPEERANPSMASWSEGDYLAQQRTRLPSHRFRRLHLNLPGLPEGAAFTAEMIMEAVDRGVPVRPPEPGITYAAGVDMSGGSNDDAVVAVAHQAADGTLVLDCVVNQGQPPPFDPRAAVARFAEVLRSYHTTRVTGDSYAGQVFKADFARQRIGYVVPERTTSQTLELLEPILNARALRLVDAPTLEQQLLGLVWRGSKIEAPPGEHDDWPAAVALALVAASRQGPRPWAAAALPPGAHHVGVPADGGRFGAASGGQARDAARGIGGGPAAGFATRRYGRW